MNLDFLIEYVVPVILGICLCTGYVLKHVVTTDKINRYIPLLMGVLGVLINAWINTSISPEILLGGLISGLASTGVHEAFKNVIYRE